MYVAFVYKIIHTHKSKELNKFSLKKLLKKYFCLLLGRYSPVRRASEGSKINTPIFQGALQECQQLQKATQRHLLTTQSPPLTDNSVSLPGKLSR